MRRKLLVPNTSQELEHAQERGAQIYAELRGYGLSCDASHMTAPLEDGYGAYLAMRRALTHAARPVNANLTSKRVELLPHVDYVNAHATSTSLGDIAEIRAIKRLLGAHQLQKEDDLDRRHEQGRAERAPVTHVSSTKGSIGHLLGAAGAVEAIFTILALRDSVIPPTSNLDHVDEDIRSVLETVLSRSDGGVDVENEIKLVDCEVQNVYADRLQIALTNSFGFGGTNASLCFGTVRASNTCSGRSS